MGKAHTQAEELRSTRLKRLRMRAWRRGMKEMDLILGRFADLHLSDLDQEHLDIFERLLEENDQDLYRWFTSQSPAPDEFSAILDRLKAHFSV